MPAITPRVTLDHEEALAVRKDCVGAVVDVREQPPRLADTKARSLKDLDRHHLAARPEEELPPVRPPLPLGSAPGRDEDCVARATERPHIHLGLPGFARGIYDPPTTGRNPGLGLAERCHQPFLYSRLWAGPVEQPEIEPTLRMDFVKKEGRPVRRPRLQTLVQGGDRIVRKERDCVAATEWP